MTEHKSNEEFPPEPGQHGISGKKEPYKEELPTNCDPKIPPEVAKLNNLTPEEQMALYEKELKEDDWGHQPC